MKILLLHLSDMHMSSENGYSNNRIEKICDALNCLSDVDKCIIVISGDITQQGFDCEFDIGQEYLKKLIIRIKKQKVNKWIEVMVVPGNHDLDFTNNVRGFKTIKKAYSDKSIERVAEKDIEALGNFYKFARRNKCFSNNEYVSHELINVSGCKVNFTLINSAVFSLKGGDNQDKGIHYLRDKDIEYMKSMQNCDLNIAVMHHSFEWFNDDIKDKIRDIFNCKYTFVFGGHEHIVYGENRKKKNNETYTYIQGNSLSGDSKHKEGFVTVVIDTDIKSFIVHSFTWEEDFYKSKEIMNECYVANKNHIFSNCLEFIKILNNDDNQRDINKLFIFPSLEYTVTDENEGIKSESINDIKDLIKVIYENDRIVISGDNKSGKTTLAKVLYKYFKDEKDDMIPLFFSSENMININFNKIVEDTFKKQYVINSNEFDKYLQLHKNQRLLIIDDADRIEDRALSKMLSMLDDKFNKIILFSNGKINLDIKKSVLDALTEVKLMQINIKPFYHEKRRDLIIKACNALSPEGVNVTKKAKELDDMICAQIKIFRLDPEFIINFVTQNIDEYKLNISHNYNIFNMVYENSIKNRIIKNAQSSDVSTLFRVFCEVAFYMHFNKKGWINYTKVFDIIDKYNNEYRQNVKIDSFCEVAKSSKILIFEGPSISFKDKDMLAYFVAHALLNNYFNEDAEDTMEKMRYLLENLCFGINSDIVLFISLITNNSNIIRLIIDSAHNHFRNIEELDFDRNNVPFLRQSDFSVKKTMPSDNEKKEKEKIVTKYEESLKDPECLELIDPYDYNENEIESLKNQGIKSIKYLEILSKILPAFGHTMKAEQQDELVKAIYKYPNCFLYYWLNGINENYDDIVNELYLDIAELRKEKNSSVINIDEVKKVIEYYAITLVISIYQLVANTTTNSHTIAALNYFDYMCNSNYQIMNLMMNGKTSRYTDFSNKAIKLNNNADIKLVKSMVRYVVRNFFLDLNSEVKIIHEIQALRDEFFGSYKSYEKVIKKAKKIK